MGSLRFLLIAVLTVALDLSMPLPHHGPEVVEEFEEVVHAQRGRRPFRHVRDSVAPAVAREIRGEELHAARPRAVAAARTVASPVLVRKIPPTAAEPSSAPEDH